MQHCRILLPKQPHDLVITCCGNLVDLAVAVLKATGLGLEGLEFRNAEAPKAWYAGGSEVIFLVSIVGSTLHMVPANERTIDPHEVDIHDVVHELEELDLAMATTTHSATKTETILDMVPVA